MRLSGWMASAPHKDSGSPKVLAVIEPILAMLGSDPDPACWVVWGEEPGSRYTLLVPTEAGMVQVNARVNVPGEGPRASGKLTRWPRVQIGDLAVEMQGGHRIMSFTLEGQILRGSDTTADQVSAFVLDVLAAVDGRQRAKDQPGSAGVGSSGAPEVVPLGPPAADTDPGASGQAGPMPQLEAPRGSSS